ncbi:hypothetical protein [Methylobacter sp.]|uniref:hypothetical protein n=1 Tax=Methylobacter sp. TaxID=2051955 RepID=UPI002FDCC8DC
MKLDYFVMLNTQNGGITPLIDADTEELATFATKGDAEKSATTCVLGYAFGFEVFERGCGV